MCSINAVTKSTYLTLLNRVGEKMLFARGDERDYWRKVSRWLRRRKDAAMRSGYITGRITPFLAKGFYDGQPVRHKYGAKGLVVGVDCEAGWVTIETDNGRELWRVGETRKKGGPVRPALVG